MNRIRRLAILVGLGLGLVIMLNVAMALSESQPRVAQEQRFEIIIRDSAFLLTHPAPVRLGMPTIIILRNQDIITHGFTSPMLAGVLTRGEGEGIVAYGKGMEGFYVDPGKTLVIRFSTKRPGDYTFRCDLHPQMKKELFVLETLTS